MREEQGLCAGPRAGKAQEPAGSGSTGRKPRPGGATRLTNIRGQAFPSARPQGLAAARRGEPGVVTVAGCAAQSGARTEDRGCVRVGEGPPDGGGGKKEGCL